MKFDLLRSDGGTMASSAAPTGTDEGAFREQTRLEKTKSSEDVRPVSAKKQG
jgi:hypothetical protein